MNDWADFIHIAMLSAVILPTVIYLDRRAVAENEDLKTRRKQAQMLVDGGTIRRVK